MRAEQSRLHAGQVDEEEEEKDAGRTFGEDKSGLEASPAQRMSGPPAGKLSSVTQQDAPPCGSWKRLLCPDTRPLPPLGGASHGQASASELRPSPVAAAQPSAKETFSSSFSFIQQCLTSGESPASQEPEPPNPQPKRPVQLLPSGDPADGEDLPSGERFWQRVPPDPPDCDSVDIEVTSSLSVDSDNASASSVTSGYDSATPASDQGRDSLVKKYEVVLQDCLQNNRTYTKVGRKD